MPSKKPKTKMTFAQMMKDAGVTKTPKAPPPTRGEEPPTQEALHLRGLGGGAFNKLNRV